MPSYFMFLRELLQHALIVGFGSLKEFLSLKFFMSVFYIITSHFKFLRDIEAAFHFYL